LLNVFGLTGSIRERLHPVLSEINELLKQFKALPVSALFLAVLRLPVNHAHARFMLTPFR
jgi:hypothetical protein